MEEWKGNRTAPMIGYMSGVYDLFHIGHLNILKKAKEQCDLLVVGVSTDELVQSCMGKTPIIPFSERVEIVKAIKYVDDVIPQTSMDIFEAWKTIRFNRIFYGDEWKGSALYQEMEQKLKAVGVEMVYFPYTKGTSSTMITKILYNIQE